MLKINILKIFYINIYQLISIIILVLITFVNSVQTNIANNIFNTVRGSGIDFLLSNYNWILYYLTGELLLLPVLQKDFLSTNPMFLIRNTSRKKLFFYEIARLVAASFTYNICFIGIQILASHSEFNFSIMLSYLIEIETSILAFTLLILSISMKLGITFSWQVAIILGIVSLFLKTNLFTLITTLNEQVIWINGCWCFLLFLDIYYLNRKIEMK